MGIHPIDWDCSMARSHLLCSDKGRPGIENSVLCTQDRTPGQGCEFGDEAQHGGPLNRLSTLALHPP